MKTFHVGIGWVGGFAEFELFYYLAVVIAGRNRFLPVEGRGSASVSEVVRGEYNRIGFVTGINAA